MNLVMDYPQQYLPQPFNPLRRWWVTCEQAWGSGVFQRLGRVVLPAWTSITVIDAALSHSFLSKMKIGGVDILFRSLVLERYEMAPWKMRSTIAISVGTVINKFHSGLQLSAGGGNLTQEAPPPQCYHLQTFLSLIRAKTLSNVRLL